MKKEIIKKVYEKQGIYVNNETIEAILADNERTKKLMKIYESGEMNICEN